ncbi:MAG: hypothetical protein IJX72_07555 [Clostridia bacterium]|nr:hypothetical protein [Clostridia bacterium]
MSHTSCTSEPAHRFAVIGGDGRMTHLAQRLTEEGYPVSLLGCGNECLPTCEGGGEMRICTTLTKAAEDATAVILPLPATRDGETVHCPRDPTCTVTFNELTALLKRNPELSLFGGKLPADFVTAVTAGDPTATTRVTDYYGNEVLQLRNAYITAEAALMTAMELTDRTLRDTSVAVLGYGRIGKYLARLLHAVGAAVTVCARREESLFEAAAEGCHPLLITPDDPMSGLLPLCRNHAIVFNTVPNHILKRELLLRLERDTLLIDLASAPFGVSDGDVREATARNGLRYLRAPSLPGTYAPRDAGRIIAECILDALSRMESADAHLTEGGKQS